LKEVSQAISFPKLPVVLSTIISGLIGVESRKEVKQKPIDLLNRVGLIKMLDNLIHHLVL